MTRRVNSVMIVLALLLAFGGVVPTGAAAQWQFTKQVDSCTTITEPGRYVLQNDLVNASATEKTGRKNLHACILVESSDVVLDGNGHRIDGTFVTSPNAASEQGSANRTLRSPPTERTLADGPDFRADSQVESVGVAVLPGQGDGRVRNVTVQDLTVSEWSFGVGLAHAGSSTVRRVEATDNTLTGIVGEDVHGSSFADNYLLTNGFAGVFVGGGSNAFVGLRTVANDVAGLAISGGRDDTVVGASSEDNGVAGIALVGTTNTDVVRSAVIGTQGDSTLGFSGGIVLTNASHNRIRDTAASDNDNWSVYTADGSRENEFTHVQLRSATVSGSGTDVAIDAVTDLPESPDNWTSIGSYASVAGTSNASSLRLTFHYDDQVVAAMEVNESSLRPWQFRDGEWTPVTGPNRTDPRQNTVTTAPDDLSAEAVLAPLGTSAAARGRQTPPSNASTPAAGNASATP